MKSYKLTKSIKFFIVISVLIVLMIIVQENKSVKNNMEVNKIEVEGYDDSVDEDNIHTSAEYEVMSEGYSQCIEMVNNQKEDKVKKKIINMNSIKNLIEQYLSNINGEVGLVLYDINSDTAIKINENNQFRGASTYKIFMNIVAYEDIKLGYGSLSDILYYSDAFYEEGTGILQYECFNSLDLQTLLDYSIIYSDNIATNMVTGYLGGMYNMLYTAGEILDENIYTSDNIITPNQMVAALKFIYNHKEEESYSHLIDVMTKTIFNDRLDKNLPKNIVAHKIGNYGEYIHDVGIVLLEDNPYIIAVYTCGVIEADKVISDISDIVYKEYLFIDDVKRYGVESIY